MEKTLKNVGHGAPVLVCGASFAGLSTAHWMSRLGYTVTVVEIGKGLKKGGSPVDIRDATVELVRRMGLYEKITRESLRPKRTEFKDEADRTVAVMPPGRDDEQASGEEYEVERDALLDIMFTDIKGSVEFMFGDSVSRLDQRESEVLVTFKSGAQRAFELVVGCDGNHSSVRKMVFGPEGDYAVFLQNYFAIAIVDKLLIDEDTTQIYNVPGKAVMLNAYNGKTDIAFCFFSEDEIAYDYRDQDHHKQIIVEQFAAVGWRTRDLLDQAIRCENFYFDKFAQIKMPFWSSGRVGLVGDAAYCATPAAGMGGSLAIIGAAALAEAFVKHEGNAGLAFQEYDRSLRPFVEKVQADAVNFGLEMFAPRTEEAIRARNARFSASSTGVG